MLFEHAKTLQLHQEVYVVSWQSGTGLYPYAYPVMQHGRVVSLGFDREPEGLWSYRDPPRGERLLIGVEIDVGPHAGNPPLRCYPCEVFDSAVAAEEAIKAEALRLIQREPERLAQVKHLQEVADKPLEDWKKIVSGRAKAMTRLATRETREQLR